MFCDFCGGNMAPGEKICSACGKPVKVDEISTPEKGYYTFGLVLTSIFTAFSLCLWTGIAGMKRFAAIRIFYLFRAWPTIFFIAYLSLLYPFWLGFTGLYMRTKRCLFWMIYHFLLILGTVAVSIDAYLSVTPDSVTPEEYHRIGVGILFREDVNLLMVFAVITATLSGVAIYYLYRIRYRFDDEDSSSGGDSIAKILSFLRKPK